MMSANELFYGDQEPVLVVDSAPYPVRKGRVSTYADNYYGYPEYPAGRFRRPLSRGRYSDYYGSDYGAYTDVDRYDYYRRPSPPRYYDDDTYESYRPVHASVHTPYAYDSTYYDSQPNEYYEYRKPSTVMLKVPICCESCSEEARNALFELRGVRSVYCDVGKEMITVSGTAAAADILQVVRKLHKKSRFWGDVVY